MYRPLKINSIHRSISGSYLNQWLRDVKHCHFSVNVGNRYNNRALYPFLVIVFVFMFFVWGAVGVKANGSSFLGGGSEFRVSGSVFCVLGSEFRVQCSVFWV